MTASKPEMVFFTGLHQPSDAKHVSPAFISVNRLRSRKSGFVVGYWIMDSGGFTEILTHGGYRHSVEVYAAEVKRWAGNGILLAAVAQDYMCEAHMLKITGMTIADHQRLTIERYDALIACDTGGVYVIPVLQGYAPADYVAHIRQYGPRLVLGAWVGVGSVCKRNGDPEAVLAVLCAIKAERPDLQLHAFGLKTTALEHPGVRQQLASADSMGWSFAARKLGRNPNDWREAAAFKARIALCTEKPPQLWQASLLF